MIMQVNLAGVLLMLLVVLYKKFKGIQKMQMRYYQPNHIVSTKLLQKCTSMPSMIETASSSNNSIQSIDDENRKLVIRWILNFTKKVQKDTQYLAISYLNRLIKRPLVITEDNFELIAMSLLLLASKMNEIYPPKITHMLLKCKKNYCKQEVIVMESTILSVFNFDIALEDTTYSYLYRMLVCLHPDKLEQCEKLYKMVAGFKEIYQFGEEILSFSIVYLIIPQFIRDMKLRENQKVKTLAIKIYNIYTEAKDKFEREKENRVR